MLGTGSIFASAFLTTIAVVGNFVATFMIVITDFYNGASTIWEFVGELIGLISTLIAVAVVFTDCVYMLGGIFISVALGIALTTESAVKIACPPVWAATLAVTIGLIFIEITNIIMDWQD